MYTAKTQIKSLTCEISVTLLKQRNTKGHFYIKGLTSSYKAHVGNKIHSIKQNDKLDKLNKLGKHFTSSSCNTCHALSKSKFLKLLSKG